MSRKAALPVLPSDDLPPVVVPQEVVTRDRQRIDCSTDRWEMKKTADGGGGAALTFNLLSADASPAGIDRRALDIVRLFCAQRLATQAIHTVKNDLETIRRFVKWWTAKHGLASRAVAAPFTWTDVKATDFLGFLAHGRESAMRGNDFARLRAFYAWGCFTAELPDFDVDVAVRIDMERAEGNIKGASVRSLDPNDGPLDQEEKRLLVQACAERLRAVDRLLAEHAAVREGTRRELHERLTEVEQLATLMIHLELGLNPQATARLHNDGLHWTDTSFVGADGRSIALRDYTLDVPRVKKRKEIRQVRRRPISRELGRVLHAIRVGSDTDSLCYWIPTSSAEGRIAGVLRRYVAGRLGIISPRTGDVLVISPRRLRYTLATDMAREGASRARIADVLDHSDLQHVEVYIESSSSVVDVVQARLDPKLAPHFRHFRITSESDPEPVRGLPRRVIPGVALQLPSVPLDLGGIGACGRDVRADGLCRLAPPMTCYICDKFVAFLEADHGALGDALEHMLITDYDGSADPRLPAQLIDALVAIRLLERQIAEEAA